MDDPTIDMTPREGLLRERNAFMESLSPEAKERFLETLAACAERGLGEEAAWQEAVLAAETTYPPETVVAESVVEEDDANL